MTDSSIYIEAENKASEYEDLEPPLAQYHTRLIHRLKKLLDVLKKQPINELDIDMVSEVFNSANDQIYRATNIKDLDAFKRIAHESKLLLIEHYPH
jgi:hypothetical protein